MDNINLVVVALYRSLKIPSDLAVNEGAKKVYPHCRLMDVTKKMAGQSLGIVFGKRIKKIEINLHFATHLLTVPSNEQK